MSQDEIIVMAREADLIDFRDADDDPHTEQMVKFLERFAALVAAKEREACAAACEDIGRVFERVKVQPVIAKSCAAAIRERCES